MNIFKIEVFPRKKKTILQTKKCFKVPGLAGLDLWLESISTSSTCQQRTANTCICTDLLIYASCTYLFNSNDRQYTCKRFNKLTKVTKTNNLNAWNLHNYQLECLISKTTVTDFYSWGIKLMEDFIHKFQHPRNSKYLHLIKKHYISTDTHKYQNDPQYLNCHFTLIYASFSFLISEWQLALQLKIQTRVLLF